MMRFLTALALAILLQAGTAAADDGGRLLQVGPQRALKSPSQAARVARDGDTIEIDAGTYKNDFTTWRQNNLTISGVGGLAHMQATRMIPNGMAIWITQGNNTLIENIEFSGARVRDTNGAGIRHQGGNLTLCGTYFHHNEFSLMTGSNTSAHIEVRRSRFWHQRRSTRWSHGIYIGEAGRFTLIGNHFLGTETGHQVKSRALENYILYNRMEDIPEVNTSRLIDLSNCGLSFVVGNDMHQGAAARNLNIIGYGMEGCEGRSERQRQLYVAHNTLVNEAHNATFVWTDSGGEALVQNNLVYGPVNFMRGKGRASDNLQLPRSEQGPERWLLPAGSPAIDAAAPLPEALPRMSPNREFSQPAGSRPRPQAGEPDIGSREFRAASQPGDPANTP